MFRHASAFCFESAAKYSETNDKFTFAWHSSVIRLVKLSSFKEEYSTEVIFLRRLQKKNSLVRQSFVLWHASAFCFESAAKYSEKKTQW